VRLLPKRYRLPALVLDATGMRIGELEALSWGDFDEPRGRWRVTPAASKTGRARWVQVPEVLFEAVTALVAREDRTPERPVFQGFGADRFRTALTRACTAAGVPTFSPHSLRHRRVSLMHLAGVPWARIGEAVGHDDITTTSRVYTHGGADEHSDVDFLVVTETDVTDEQLAGLQAMHGRLYDRDVPWAQHLEGSYAPREILRRVNASRTPFLFLDNGATELVCDDHCNTAVVRWTLRERSIVLAGPDPKTFVEPVTAAELRDEMRRMVRDYAEWAPEPTAASPMSRWKQPYLVLTVCRILHTSATATVTSKREAGVWALRALDPEWAPLIQRALDGRADPWLRVHGARRTCGDRANARVRRLRADGRLEAENKHQGVVDGA
jgi:hypothetical protein